MAWFRRKRNDGVPDERTDRRLGRLSILGQMALAEGDPEDALRYFTKLVRIFTERAGPTHDRTLVWKGFSAKALSALGRVEEALALQREVIAERTAALGPDHPDTLSNRGQLGQTLTRNGRPAEGLEVQEAAYADKVRVLGADHTSTMNTLGNIAEALLLCEYFDDAVDAYEHLLTQRTRVLGPDHPDTEMTASNLAIARARAAGGDPAALDGLVANLDEAIRRHGADSPDAFTARGYIAEHHIRCGDGHAALAALLPLLEDRTETLGDGHPDTLRTRQMIVDAVDLVGDETTALVELDEVITQLVLQVGPNDTATFRARLRRLQILTDAGKADVSEVVTFGREVDATFDRAHPIHDQVDALLTRVIGHDPDQENDS